MLLPERGKALGLTPLPPPHSGDHTIRVWALSSSAAPPVLRHVVPGHEDTVCSMVASRDGAFLYSGSDDRQGGVRVK